MKEEIVKGVKYSELADAFLSTELKDDGKTIHFASVMRWFKELAEKHSKAVLEAFIDDHFPENSLSPLMRATTDGNKFSEYVIERLEKEKYQNTTATYGEVIGSGFRKGSYISDKEDDCRYSYPRHGVDSFESVDRYSLEEQLKKVIELKNWELKNRQYETAAEYRDKQIKLESKIRSKIEDNACAKDKSFVGDSLDHKILVKELTESGLNKSEWLTRDEIEKRYGDILPLPPIKSKEEEKFKEGDKVKIIGGKHHKFPIGSTAIVSKPTWYKNVAEVIGKDKDGKEIVQYIMLEYLELVKPS